MDKKEGWGLTEEEIQERLRQINQQSAKRGPTRGGRSSGQGVKLLYIRDYLYAHATKEHPKNARHIRDFLLSIGIEAHEKTIYNDILRLQTDFNVPIEYDAKR